MKRILAILILMMGITTMVWGEDYEFVKKWGDCGRWDGAFQYPMGITLDAPLKLKLRDSTLV